MVVHLFNGNSNNIFAKIMKIKRSVLFFSTLKKYLIYVNDQRTVDKIFYLTLKGLFTPFRSKKPNYREPCPRQFAETFPLQRAMQITFFKQNYLLI